MADRTDGTVTAVTVDTSVSPPVYAATVSFPAKEGPPAQEAETKTFTPLDKEHFDRFEKALGTNLKVDVRTQPPAQQGQPEGGVTRTTVHT